MIRGEPRIRRPDIRSRDVRDSGGARHRRIRPDDVDMHGDRRRRVGIDRPTRDGDPIGSGQDRLADVPERRTTTGAGPGERGQRGEITAEPVHIDATGDPGHRADAVVLPEGPRGPSGESARRVGVGVRIAEQRTVESLAVVVGQPESVLLTDVGGIADRVTPEEPTDVDHRGLAGQPGDLAEERACPLREIALAESSGLLQIQEAREVLRSGHRTSAGDEVSGLIERGGDRERGSGVVVRTPIETGIRRTLPVLCEAWIRVGRRLGGLDVRERVTGILHRVPVDR
jgi:hypothetical protein